MPISESNKAVIKVFAIAGAVYLALVYWGGKKTGNPATIQGEGTGILANTIYKNGLQYNFSKVDKAKVGNGYVAMYIATTPAPQGTDSVITESISEAQYNNNLKK
ncbi:MAG TPA: hypothetical protein VN026_13580 [Bacteroidia bacterium]|jgi:hypothetical protein|nr:hypothetical protein [Bacteroidia bacterium]